MHIEATLYKVNKGISIIIKKLTLPRKYLLTIYKAFVTAHIKYGNIIYDQPSNESFCEKLEPVSIYYKAALPVTGAVEGISRNKNFMELGL